MSMLPRCKSMASHEEEAAIITSEMKSPSTPCFTDEDGTDEEEDRQLLASYSAGSNNCLTDTAFQAEENGGMQEKRVTRSSSKVPDCCVVALRLSSNVKVYLMRQNANLI
ncbi:unnamed protein product [Strongylus vulgaris]|uniref:Uncharacterized protein n=1 Tax=Strongylus vulgaris TaxID=40348 RepID=A0A3P7M1G0_STRVU|nr:unnamed protein product [Strongylus vulgaris]